MQASCLRWHLRLATKEAEAGQPNHWEDEPQSKDHRGNTLEHKHTNMAVSYRSQISMDDGLENFVVIVYVSEEGRAKRAQKEIHRYRHRRTSPITLAVR